MISNPLSADTPTHRPHVAIAILHQQQPDGSLQFLMQLRDDIPGIAYPGHWGFFGGHIELGESPDVAVTRELVEEINYVPPSIHPFKVYDSPRSIRHVFHAPFITTLDALTLREGWDMRLLTVDDIQKGECYSAAAENMKPIGEPHQAILMEFLEQALEQTLKQALGDDG
ncbi:MAG: NUDIX hydrolase [Cyanobacteria bacterium P01_E01_bin.6]